MLLDENRDIMCLVVSPLGELEADDARRRLSLEITNLAIVFLCLGSVCHRDPQDTCVVVNRARYVPGFPRVAHTERRF